MEDVKGKTLKLREYLTLVSIEDKAALLDVERRCYFDPNDTASFLLKLMEDGCLYEDVKVALVSEFDVAEETAQVEIDNFIEELLRLSLIDIGETTAHEVVCEPRGEKKAYRAPQLEHQAEIAVVAGSIGLTPE